LLKKLQRELQKKKSAKAKRAASKKIKINTSKVARRYARKAVKKAAYR